MHKHAGLCSLQLQPSANYLYLYIDRFLKWRMTAKMNPSSNMAQGSGCLVHHPSRDNEEKEGEEEVKHYALVTQIDGQICTLTDDGSSTFEQHINTLRQYDSTIDFDIHRMNVQGGGILTCTDLSKEKLSMRWLDAVSEKEGDIENKFHAGCWYFDPTQRRLDPTNLEVTNMRRDIVQMIEDDETMLTEGKIWNVVQKKLIDALVRGNMPNALNIVPFQQVLMCIPFFMLIDIVRHWLAIHKGERAERELLGNFPDIDFCLVFYSMVKIGRHLRHDLDWHSSNSKFEAWVRSVQPDDGDVQQQKDAHIYQITKMIGEWYEEVKEFRAAIWCYNLVLSSVRDPSFNMPPEAREDSFVALKSYVGLANKRMDNFVDAYKYNEEAIVAKKASAAPIQSYSLTGNCKILQEEAREWFGTSGRITSFFETSDHNDITVMKCSSCGADGAAKKCSACHVVCYCNVNCQKKHWKVHTKTCLGKLRGK